MSPAMTEWWWALIGLAILAAAVVAGRLTGRSRTDALPAAPTDLGPYPAVLLFSSDSCASCAPARTVIDSEAGARWREHPWEIHPGILGRLRIDSVPTTWVVDADGRIVDVIEGIPATGRIARRVSRWK